MCERNIEKDLRYYYTLLAAYPDPDRFLNNSVLFGLRELMKVSHLQLHVPL